MEAIEGVEGKNPEEMLPQMLNRVGFINRTLFVRFIIESLHSLGYEDVALILESESGVRPYPPEYESLRSLVLSGQWKDCIANIKSLKGLNPKDHSIAEKHIWGHHFLELLASDDNDSLRSAISVLRHHIVPLESEVGGETVHRLACSVVSLESVIMPEEKLQRREDLLKILVCCPSLLVVPNKMLEALMETAVILQQFECPYHNLPIGSITLYGDHRCSPKMIPSKCIQTLNYHTEGVLFVQFSNNGMYLASSSGSSVVIWKVTEDDTLLIKRVLRGHTRPIVFIAWSPDDEQLLTCGNSGVLRIWDTHTGLCMRRFCGHDHIKSCAWFPGSNLIVCGGCRPAHSVYTCDVDTGCEVEVLEGNLMPGVSDLAVTPDGHHLISIFSSNVIRIRNLQTREKWDISESHSITSLSLASCGEYLLVNLLSEEIHIWKVDVGNTVPLIYRGHKQANHAIRSCFRVPKFIASGSEDSQIYIWFWNNPNPIRRLSGHQMAVNCVSWNPERPHMLASASDDCTIRIWV